MIKKTNTYRELFGKKRFFQRYILKDDCRLLSCAFLCEINSQMTSYSVPRPKSCTTTKGPAKYEGNP